MLRALPTALALVALASSPAPAAGAACPCAPAPDLVWQWGQLPEDVVAARVLASVDLGSRQLLVTRVRRAFSGCLADGDLLYVLTRRADLPCALPLAPGQTWLLATDAAPFAGGRWLASMTACDLHRPVASITPAERTWLAGRMACCDGACTCGDGSEPVLCFADPCTVAPACPEGACVANTCGGCHAEHYTADGELVCTPCAGDADCGPGQTCAASGQCLFGCASDEDCPESQWCRETLGGGAVCVDYAAEGEACGGLAPPWALQLCAPGFACTDFIPWMFDGPGRCRKLCEGDAGCPKDGYCAVDGVCRADASCKAHADCGLAGNAYVTPKCLGYGGCLEGACAWVCGEEACQDVDGVDLGACEMLLGWGVVHGLCAPISGCGPDGYAFFPDPKACEAGCPPPCLDLGGTFFGPCDAVLGAGVVDGACAAISGCDAQGFRLFDDVKACVAACGGPGPCADAAGVDFGDCAMPLGWTVVGGACKALSGCGTQGYAFYPSEVACFQACADGCGPWYAAYEALSTGLKACTTADTCVDVPGTSCGCTRNLVVNGSFDLGPLKAMVQAMGEAGCPLVSPCDCPPADGFACTDGLCQWSYL